MNTHFGSSSPSGGLTNILSKPQSLGSPPILDVLKRGLPNKALNPAVNAWRKANAFRLLQAATKLWAAERVGVHHFYGALYLTIIRPTVDTTDLMKEYAAIYPVLNGVDFVTWAAIKHGIAFQRQHLGLAGLRVVTDTFVAYIVDAFQGTVEPELVRYHGIGTGSTAESASQTALVTELTTEYNPDSTRATGSLTEGASANIFRSIGTNTLDGTPGAALREHSLFSQAATGGGTMADRTLFAAITLSSGDGLQSTYDLTFPSGS